MWVDPDDRKAALQVHSDFLYQVIHDFFKEEAQKLKKIIGRQPRIPSSKSIQQAVKEALDEYDWTPWYEVLRPQVQHLLEEAFMRGANQTWDALRQADISLTWDTVATKAQHFARQRAGELVGMHVNPDGTLVPAKDPKMRITDDTRLKLNAWIQYWLKEGRTWQQIADLIYKESEYIGFPYMSDWRARRIARTEAAFAYNRGQISSLREAGFGKVEVIDGIHDEICASVNHKIWTLAEAEANPLGHPHCSRHFLPVVDDDVHFRKQMSEPPDSFSTAAEAEAWMKNKYPDVATDFSGVDPELLGPLVKEVDRLFTRYPYVAKTITYIGSYKDQLGRQLHHEADETKAYAFASTLGHLYLSPYWWSDAKRIRDQYKMDVDAGFHPKGITDPVSALTHEFGHFVHYWLLDRAEQGFAFEPYVLPNGFGLVGSTVDRVIEKIIQKNPVSIYAKKNEREAFAEAFTVYEWAIKHGEKPKGKAARAVQMLVESITPGRLYYRGQWRPSKDAPSDIRDRLWNKARRWGMA